eukprot:4689467-Pyramimonas_sp.AAC.1
MCPTRQADWTTSHFFTDGSVKDLDMQTATWAVVRISEDSDGLSYTGHVGILQTPAGHQLPTTDPRQQTRSM